MRDKDRKYNRIQPSEQLSPERAQRRHSLLARCLTAVLAVAFTVIACNLSVTPVRAASAGSGADDSSSAAEAADSSGFEQSITVKESSGDLTITVQADDGVLPSGAELAVSPILKNGYDTADTYTEVEDRVQSSLDEDTEIAGLLAYDISFLVDGEEVEPDGNVRVTMEWENATAPDEAGDDADVSVLHIENNQDTPIPDAEVTDLTENARADAEANTAVVTTAEDGNKVETVEMDVEQFSVFTITWTKSGSDATRIGQVNLYYVDTNGLEHDLTDDSQTSVAISELSMTNGGIIDIASTWGSKSIQTVNSESSSNTYSYDHAAIGTRKGLMITGLKVEETSSGSDSYKLYYTTDSSVNTEDSTANNWKEYTDSVSGNNANNANVYLIYKKTTSYTYPVKVHFMSANSAKGSTDTPVAIKGSDGKDIVDTMDGANFAGSSSAAKDNAHNFYYKYLQNNVPNGYKYDYSLRNNNQYKVYRVYYDNDMSKFFMFLNYYSDTLYWAQGGTEWAAFDSTPEFYVSLAIADSYDVTVHHVDADGNKVADDTTVSESVNGELTLDAAKSSSASGYNASALYYGGYSGTKVYSLTYSQANNQWKSAAKASSGDTASDTTNIVDEVWVVYDEADSMNVAVHHMNALGAEIAPATLQKVTNGTSLTADSITKAAGRTSGYDYSAYYYVNDSKTSFSSITYTYDDTSWTSTVDSGTAGSPVKDVYLLYTPTTSAGLKILYVDESGGYLHAPATASNSIYQDTTWDGWSLPQANVSDIGAYQFGYLGAFGSNKISYSGDTKYAAMYKKDSDGTWHTGIGLTTNAATKAATQEVYASDGTTPILLTDIYQVYGGSDAKKGITYHHVDENGNMLAADTYAMVSSGGSVTPSGAELTSISGMVYSAAHIGSYDGTEVNQLTYTYDSTQDDSTKRWSSTYTSDTQTTETSTDTAVNEVWLVYTEGTQKTRFNLHYVYLGTNNTAEDIADVNNITDTTFTVTNDGTRTWLNSKGDLVKTGLVNKSGSQLEYMSTRIGTSDGFDASAVYADADGNIVYQNGDTYSSSDTKKVSYTTYSLYSESSSENTWTGSGTGGREFELKKDSDGNLTLVDSQHGSVTLNRSSKRSGENSGYNYTATFHGEEETTTYQVFEGTNAETIKHYGAYYRLRVENYITSDSNDVYLVYIDKAGGDGKIWIDDDVKYTGMLKAGTSGVTLPDGHNYWYEWHRVVTTADGASSTTRSTRALPTDQGYIDTQYAAASDGTVITIRAWQEYDDVNDASTLNGKFSSATLTASDGSVITVTKKVSVSSGAEGDTTYTVTATSGGTTETKEMPAAGSSSDITAGSLTATVALDNNGKVTITTTSGDTTISTTTLDTVSAATTTDTKDTALTDTERKQTGDHWNVAGNAYERTWLDVEADEGSDIWTSDSTVKYYVTLTYQKTNAQEPTAIISNIFNLSYYGQLENGSFEIPNIINFPQSTATATAADLEKYYNGTDFSNESYKANAGVWQTTGVGTGSNKGKDIEVINVTKNPSADYSSYYFASEDTFKANDGNQFVELNAEAAGALYQDVITHPNETLTYGLSHRARGNATSKVAGDTPEYDTMYLVIMPTKLAMTSGSGGTELTSQSDLLSFIEDHGGISYDKPTEADMKTSGITYNDKENGILVYRITSSDQAWNTISAINGYIAKGGLTRFFFVAGPTAYEGESNQTVYPKEYGDKDHVINATHGNFLDKVYFSQSLPEPEGFNMTVTKTFKGLTQAQIAALSTNRGISNGDNDSPFTFTITNTYQQSGVTHTNDALEYVKLQFSATQTGADSYTFTPVATQWQHKTTESGDTVWEPITEDEYEQHKSDTENYRAVNLFDSTEEESGNTGSARVNADGSVTLTWTFTEQSLPSYAADLTFNYSVTETGGSVSGLIQTPTYTLNSGTTEAGSTGMIGITQGNTARYAFTNTYKENTGNPSQITVTKTFSGVTRTTVEKLLAGYSETIDGTEYDQDPFEITIRKTVKDDGTAITESDQPSLTLTPTNIGRVAVRGSGASTEYANVSYNLTEDTTNGKVTLTWIIQEEKPSSASSTDADEWMGGPGTYSISEKNFTPTPYASSTDKNELQTVTVNGKNIEITDKSAGTVALGTVQAGKVGSSDDDDYSPRLSPIEDKATDITTNPTSLTVDADSNLIIGRTSDDSYVVWTEKTAGANVRQSVIRFINQTAGLGKDSSSGADDGVEATLANTSFRSGENPGTLKYNTQHSDTTITYDGGTTATFANETVETGTPVTWTRGYAAVYELPDYTFPESDTEHYGMTNTDTEARITNGYEPIVRIKKVDAESETTVLGGAVFHLYKYVEGTPYYLQAVATTTAEATWTTDISSAYPVTTAADGIISLGKLPEGTYYLDEITAPVGYAKLARTIGFSVDGDGNVEAADGTSDGENVDNSKADIDWNSPYYTITIANNASSPLPITGGRGIWMFIITGLLLIADAMYLLHRKRMREAAAGRKH